MAMKKGTWNEKVLANPAMKSRDDSYSQVKLEDGEAFDIDSAMTNLEKKAGENIIHINTLDEDIPNVANVAAAVQHVQDNLDEETTERQAADTTLQNNIDAEISRATTEEQKLADDIATNAQDISALKGVGGALTATDLGEAPTQEELTQYAVNQIWTGATDFTWNEDDPAASTFNDKDGTAHTAAEIFNATWVNNLNSDPAQYGHKWQLTNTQNTEPKVFEWADVGESIVSIATKTLAGVVRGAGQVIVDSVTGDMSLDPEKADEICEAIGALKKSGDIMTGSLEINMPAGSIAPAIIFNDGTTGYGIATRGNEISFGQYIGETFSDQFTFNTGATAFYSKIAYATLGTEEHKWETVFATKINNGVDLEVPTEGTALATIEDVMNHTELPEQTGHSGEVLSTNGESVLWTTISNIATPAGAILAYAGSTPPAGFLICDGAAVSRTTYAALFAVIGTTYGAGDGNSTFNLPNLDGRAPWYDSTATIGGISNGSLPNITGTIIVYTAASNIYNDAAGAFQMFNGTSRGESYAYSGVNQGFSFDASRVSSVYNSGSTVRPAAVYTNWCIKF